MTHTFILGFHCLPDGQVVQVPVVTSHIGFWGGQTAIMPLPPDGWQLLVAATKLNPEGHVGVSTVVLD